MGNEMMGQGEILLYSNGSDKEYVSVVFKDETFWLTQKAMAELFDVNVPAVSKHLQNIYEEQELSRDATISKMETVRQEGERQVKRTVDFYNLDAIIAVGYRVNSKKATRFRQWATKTLKEYIQKGFVLNDEMMKNGRPFGKDYFDELLERIREIRASERRFYQKITDIYATAVDYSVDSKTTKDFFATVQNKMHYAVHGSTAAEVIVQRADHTKDHMGLTSWKNAPNGKIVKADVSVAKNYLQQDELQELNEIVTMYLDYATRQARRHIPMTMQDWAEHLDRILTMSGEQLLIGNGSITHKQAVDKATGEYRKYKTRTLSDVENDYLNSIKMLEQKTDGKK